MALGIFHGRLIRQLEAAVRRLVAQLAVAPARGLALVHHLIAGDESFADALSHVSCRVRGDGAPQRYRDQKRGDLFFRCGVDLRRHRKNKEGLSWRKHCETDIWYRCSCNGDIVWNFDEPSFWRCSLVRGEKPWKRRRVLGLPIPHI
jgi:hypothetical protein